MMKVPGPDHPITVTPNPKRVLVKFAGHVVADSTHALTLQESTYPAVQYIPRSEVDMKLLERTTHRDRMPLQRPRQLLQPEGERQRVGERGVDLRDALPRHGSDQGPCRLLSEARRQHRGADGLTCDPAGRPPRFFRGGTSAPAAPPVGFDCQALDCEQGQAVQGLVQHTGGALMAQIGRRSAIPAKAGSFNEEFDIVVVGGGGGGLARPVHPLAGQRGPGAREGRPSSAARRQEGGLLVLGAEQRARCEAMGIEDQRGRLHPLHGAAFAPGSLQRRSSDPSA